MRQGRKVIASSVIHGNLVRDAMQQRSNLHRVALGQSFSPTTTKLAPLLKSSADPKRSGFDARQLVTSLVADHLWTYSSKLAIDDR